MGLVDIFILLTLGFFLLKGALRGLLREICSLLGLILGGVLAFTFHLPLAQVAQDHLGVPSTIAVWGTFLLVFLTVVAIFAVLGFVLHRFVKIVLLGGVNRVSGALFGVVQAVVLLAMIVLAVQSSLAPESGRRMVAESHLAPPFVDLGVSLLEGGRELVGKRP